MKNSELAHVVVVYEHKMFASYFYVAEHLRSDGVRLSRDIEKRSNTWWDFVPYDINKDLGKKVNDFCEKVPDGDWIIIRDGDTAYLDATYGHLIQGVIDNNKSFDLMGCVTNRLGLEWQVPYPYQTENYDMSFHTLMAQNLKMQHQSRVNRTYMHVAGLFMMFNKQAWDQIKFTEKIIDSGGYMDYHFSSEVLRRNGNVGIMPGLYLYHNYRILSGTSARFNNQHIR
jgi:hypothetical protein